MRIAVVAPPAGDDSALPGGGPTQRPGRAGLPSHRLLVGLAEGVADVQQLG